MTLCFSDTLDKASAVLVDFVAQRPGGARPDGGDPGTTSSASAERRNLGGLTDPDIMVLEDVKAAEAEIHPETLVELKTRRVRSFIMAELSLRTRVWDT
ncbi:MAG: hypothetical protein IPK19_24635 [Chloroflexi bacterium]|nr:hypothetical protein [Chloroflexota bacterium]